MIARRQKYLSLGLLPRMDAYRRRDGTFRYRFKTFSGDYVDLGQDERGKPMSGLADAKRKAIDIAEGGTVNGSLADVVGGYFKSFWYRRLADRTKRDYMDEHWPQVKAVFGELAPDAIDPTMIAKYMREERANAPVRANREIRGFLSSVYEYAIEVGCASSNPCRQVRRNPERPRTEMPAQETIEMFLTVAERLSEQNLVVALLGLATAYSGARRGEIIRATLNAMTDEGLVARENKTTGGKDYLITPGEKLWPVLQRAASIARTRGSLYLFPNRDGVPYQDSGFKTEWNKLMHIFQDGGGEWFTAYDLRAFFATKKIERGEEPEIHRNPATTRRVYDRRRTIKRSGL